MALMAPTTSGIYLIANTVTGKVYVGSAANVRTRWRKHRNHLAAGTHPNAHLQAAWSRYGEPAFAFSVLEVATSAELIEAEQRHIDAWSAASPEHGYNILPNARSPLGRTYGPEFRARVSLAAQRRGPISAETRERLSASRRGIKRDPAIGQRVGAMLRGRVIPPEQRAKIAATLRGRSLSADHRAKLSAALLGKSRSSPTAATRRKIAIALSARWHRLHGAIAI